MDDFVDIVDQLGYVVRDALLTCIAPTNSACVKAWPTSPSRLVFGRQTRRLLWYELPRGRREKVRGKVRTCLTICRILEKDTNYHHREILTYDCARTLLPIISSISAISRRRWYMRKASFGSVEYCQCETLISLLRRKDLVQLRYQKDISVFDGFLFFYWRLIEEKD